jgi:hypothetical protein
MGDTPRFCMASGPGNRSEKAQIQKRRSAVLLWFWPIV